MIVAAYSGCSKSAGGLSMWSTASPNGGEQVENRQSCLLKAVSKYNGFHMKEGLARPPKMPTWFSKAEDKLVVGQRCTKTRVFLNTEIVNSKISKLILGRVGLLGG